MCLLCRICAGHPNDTSNQLLTTPGRVPTRAINQSGICRLPSATASRGAARVRISFPPDHYAAAPRATHPEHHPISLTPTRLHTHLQDAPLPSIGFHVPHFLAVLPHRLYVSFSTMMVRRDKRTRDVRPVACGSVYAVCVRIFARWASAYERTSGRCRPDQPTL